jgi:hypothetical protein
MGILPLFSSLPSRHSDSLSITTTLERQTSHPCDSSLDPGHKSDQKGPRLWLVRFESKFNPMIVGKKKANRNRILVVAILVIVVGGSFAL